jgi:hypothetical protein
MKNGMSLEHSPVRQRIRQRNDNGDQSIRTERSTRNKHALDAPLSPHHDDQVLTFFEWCQLNRISERTGRRILANPDPAAKPVVTMLTTTRLGITVGANRRWQQSRKRT